MPKRKSPLGEWLLAFFTDSGRASAMYGDILELASSRGRLWFWLAYLRTLLALGWRLPIALAATVFLREAVFNLFHVYIRHTPATWRAAGGSLYLPASMGPLLATVMSTLWSTLPWAAVLYGGRDRFVRLAATLTFGTTIAFMYLPWASLVAGALTLALAAASFRSRRWRAAFELFASTTAIGMAALAAVMAIQPGAQLRRFLRYHPGVLSHPLVFAYVQMIFFDLALIAAPVACLLLHRRFIGSQGDGAGLRAA